MLFGDENSMDGTNGVVVVVIFVVLVVRCGRGVDVSVVSSGIVVLAGDFVAAVLVFVVGLGVVAVDVVVDVVVLK